MKTYKEFLKEQVILESIEKDINLADTTKYPKIEFNPVDVSKRAGTNIRGSDILGWMENASASRALLVPNKFDYKYAKEVKLTVKSDEILVRFENILTKRVGKSFENAHLGKINLKTKTVTFLDPDTIDDIKPKWDKAVRAKRIIIHLPFRLTSD